MSAKTAKPGVIVRVHKGVTVAGHHLGGMHLTVISVPAEGALELSEWAGNRVFLRAEDVDVVTVEAGAA